MYYPSLKEFLKLSRKFNLIPVYKEINADLDTPVSAFLKIDKDDYAFLLESVEGHQKIARYSFLGSRPSFIIKSKGKNILDELKRLMKDFKPCPIEGLPRFYGGLVGYIGYDAVRFFEKIPDKNPDDLKLFDSVFMLTYTLLIFDHVNHTIKLITNIILPKGKLRLSQNKKVKLYKQAVKEIELIQRAMDKSIIQKESKVKKCVLNHRVRSNFKKTEFQELVLRAKEYIKRGDIIQVVLSQRFKVETDNEPFDIYRTLRSLNPSPYMFFLKLKEVILIGSSPEMLVRCEDGIVETRPIAGTRARGKNEKEDERLESELINDDKEKAEHLMLVDLGRNDLGRVCKSGKVEVGEFMGVERYSHVMHLVSEVKGTLDKRFDVYDVLKACFPAGTVTGSPKIRAMEIIDELENLRRGPYAGCVGYFSFSQNLDTCITIRTVVIKGSTAYIQAGAGIVADSVPEKEYFETVNKAKALIEAIRK